MSRRKEAEPDHRVVRKLIESVPESYVASSKVAVLSEMTGYRTL